MSVSLIGIITVQIYWVNNSLENRKAQFNNDAQIALINTCNLISENEQDQLYLEYQPILAKKELADAGEIKNYLFQKYDKSGKKVFSFGATILEENFKIPVDFIDNDTLLFKRINIKKDYFQAKVTGNTGDFLGGKNEKRISFSHRANSLEKQQIASVLSARNRFEPIHKRTSNKEIQSVLKKELKKRNINIDFKFGVYTTDGLATKLKSGYYRKEVEDNNYPLFIDENGDSEYKLFVSFPSKNKLILSGISNILLLSLFFIFIIIVTFSSSLYQLIRQKKISEIKNRFHQ